MTANRMLFFLRFALFYGAARALGLDIIPYEFHRTTNRQQELYAKGRTEPGKIVTWKDGVVKRSKHQDWLAIDVCLVKDGEWIWPRCPEYERLGKIAKALGLRWGGDWDSDDEIDSTDFDIYHFELG